MSKKPILTPAQLKWAYEKRLRGYTNKDIAAALFVGAPTLVEAFKRNNMKKPELPPLKYDFKETNE